MAKLGRRRAIERRVMVDMGIWAYIWNLYAYHINRDFGVLKIHEKEGIFSASGD